MERIIDGITLIGDYKCESLSIYMTEPNKYCLRIKGVENIDAMFHFSTEDAEQITDAINEVVDSYET